MHTDDFLDWATWVEQFSGWKELPNHKNVKYVVIRLQGHAITWWVFRLCEKEREKGSLIIWRRWRKECAKNSFHQTMPRISFLVLSYNPRHEKCWRAYNWIYELLSWIKFMGMEIQVIVRYITGLNSHV